MEQSNIKEKINSKDDKIKFFFEGAALIFKKWTSFRLIVDNNPHILNEYADEEETTLEINQMLDLLMNDILTEMSKSYGGELENNLADMLFAFVEEFFEVELQDQSEYDVAKCLARLYSELDSGKFDYLLRLRAVDKNFNYSNFNIPFPITKPIDTNKLSNEFSDKLNVNQEENTNTNMNIDMNVDSNIVMTTTTSNEPDEDGFIVVKKGKKF